MSRWKLEREPGAPSLGSFPPTQKNSRESLLAWYCHPVQLPPRGPIAMGYGHAIVPPQPVIHEGKAKAQQVLIQC